MTYLIPGPNQEGCEEIEISSGDGADCDQSTYGCCPDGVTMAQGPSNEGCDGVVVEVPDTDVYYPDRERVNVDVTSGKVGICLNFLLKKNQLNCSQNPNVSGRVVRSLL